MTTIAIARDNAVGVITLNRPGKRNALNRDMCIALRRAVLELGADETLHMILVRANGPVFCAGADLSERKAMAADAVRARRMLAFSAYDAIECASKPCIAVVDGAAIGAGAEIASACDFIVATERATFKYPEAGWGTIGATQRLPELVGRRNAKDLLFTGRQIDAQEAQGLGLVSRLVQSACLEEQVGLLCDSIKAAPPAVLTAVKRCVDDRAQAGRHAALAMEMLSIERLLASPSWKGRMDEFD